MRMARVTTHEGVSTHAAIRLRQRYRLTVTPELRDTLLDKIRHGKHAVLKYYNKRAQRPVYKVRHGKRTFMVVVNKALDTIVTFLPHEPRPIKA